MRSVKDRNKTKEQLINELTELRQHVAQLEKSAPEQPLQTNLYDPEKLKQLIEYYPDMVVATTPDNRFALINRAGINMLGGSTAEQFIGKSILDIVHPSYKEATEKRLTDNAKNVEELPLVEEKYIRLDGKEINVVVKSLSLHLENCPFKLAIVQDITERKLAEEAYTRSEQNMRYSLDHSPFGIIIINRDGEKLYYNQAFLDLYGYDSIEELNKTPISQRLTPQSHIEYLEREKLRRKGEIPDDFEVDIIRKNREICHLAAFVREVLWNGQPQYQITYQDITEESLIKKSLVQSEEKFRLLAENSICGMVIIQNYTILYANPPLARMFGYTPEELIGHMTLADVTHPDDIGILLQRYKDRLAGEKEDRNNRYRGIKKDGSVIDFEVHSVRTEYQGKPAIMATVLDITEQKRAEAALLESEDRYKTVTEKAPNGIFILQDNHFVYANQAAASMSGYTLEELLGKKFFQVVTSDFRELLSDSIKEIMSGNLDNLHRPADISIIRKDGDIRWLNLTTDIITYKGKPSFLGNVVDITDRKKTEEALRESEDRYKTVTESFPIGLCIFQNDRIVYANQAAASLSGYSPSELAAMDYNDLVAPDSLEILSNYWTQCNFSNSEIVRQPIDFNLIRKDGKIRWVSITPNIITYKGKPSILVNMVDITERKKAEEDLQISEENLRNSLDSSPLGIDIINSENNKIVSVYANKAFLDLFGFKDIDEFNNTPMEQRFTPESYRESAKRREKELKGEPIPSQYEITIKRKNGDTRRLVVFRKAVIWNHKKHTQILHMDITERVKAEQALHESEKNFRNSLDNSPLGIDIIDDDLNSVYVNKALLDIFEFKDIDEFNNTPMEQRLIPESYRDSPIRRDKLDKRDLVPYQFEITIRRKNGDIRHLAVFRKVIIWNHKKHTLVLHMDITERRTAEQALQKSEENFRNSLDNLPLGVAIISGDDEVDYVNQATLDLWGYDSLEEYRNSSFSQRYTAEGYAKFMERKAKRAKGELLPKEFEIEIQRKNGEVRNIRTIRNNDVFWNGQKRFLVLFYDITENNKAIEALRESEERLRAFGNSLPDLAFVLNDKGTIEDIIAGTEMLMYKEKNDLIKKTLHDILPWNIAQLGLNAVTEAIKTGITQSIEYQLTVPIGTRMFEGRISPMLPTGEGKNTVAVIVRDITEQKKAEEQLNTAYNKERELRKSLEKEAKRRMEFSRALVHELKTPLTSVIATSEIMASELKEEPWASMAKNIFRGGENLSKRIDELLDLTRGEIGMLNVNLGPVKPLKLLNDIVGEYISLTSSRQQALIVDLPESLPIITADEIRIRQVICNLLNNACKFTSDGGKIIVRARQENSNLLVEVQDNGMGLTVEQQAKLFHPYERVDADRQKLSGLGLGLALSKNLVELHHGKIWVESSKGKGSTFSFYIPIKGPDSTPEEKRAL